MTDDRNIENVVINPVNTIEPSELPQKIMVFPKGKWYIQKYKNWVDFNDSFFNSIATSFDNASINKPFIDKNHLYEDSFGDILSYEITDNGMVFEIKLNANGLALIKEETYKYISPSFGPYTDVEGKEWEQVLFTVSLTNFPALGTANPTLQSQIKLNRRQKMKRLKELSNLLGIQAFEYADIPMDETVVVEEPTIETEEVETESQEMDVIIEAVKKVIAETDALKSMLEQMEAEKNKIVEEKQVIEQESIQKDEELEAVKKEKLVKEANEVILEAIKKGQYVPSLKELKVEQYISDKDSVVKELSVIPEVEQDKQMTNNSEKLTGLALEDEKIMVSLKLDPSNQEHIKMYKTANKMK